LWGEYPNPNRGGDMWSYMMGAESSNGEYTNLHRGAVGYTFNLDPKWTMKAQYSLLWADQEYLSATGTKTGPTGTRFTEGGLFRGQMISGILTYKCCKNLSMHFLVDYFQPGSYYDLTTRDDAYFLRYNLEFTF
jgi:hypothetical protein